MHDLISLIMWKNTDEAVHTGAPLLNIFPVSIFFRINIAKAKNNASVEVDEESESNIHRSLRLEFLVLSLVVTVVAMNVKLAKLG